MYKVVPWSVDLDLTEFYAEAALRGFSNNNSQQAMVDCFNNEREKQVWILYKNDKAVGSVAAHSFDEVMGPGSYRVLTRVCTFAEARPSKGLITSKRLVAEHQNLTDQFLLPACIAWAKTKNLYSTSTADSVASQELVHKFYFPTLEKIGVVERVGQIHYRNTNQTLWRINVDAFEANLKRYPRWI
jgi:hypothetical protein